MSEELKDGGPAFPQPALALPNSGYHVPEGWEGADGMSLRDWFAGQALVSGNARASVSDWEQLAYFGPHKTGIKREEILAAEAYAIADAMLTERLRSLSA